MENELDKTMLAIGTLIENRGIQSDYMKSFMSITVRDILESVLNEDEDPLPNLIETLKLYENLFKNRGGYLGGAEYIQNKETVFDKTTDMYGKLFVDLKDEDVLEEAHDLLQQRLEKNKIDPKTYKGERCLDAGCGGGRYSIALKKMGAKIVEGVDGASDSICDAQDRIARHNITGCNFSVQNVLDLEFSDNYFGFVMSYGVLHHTTDMKKGLEECYRVLKKDGSFFLFLMSCNGLRYKVIQWLRTILKDVDPNLTQSIMKQMGYDSRKIFNFVDNLHVPIHVNITKDGLEEMLLSIGFKNLRWLKRDVETERWTHPTELIYQDKPYARLKYGDGAYKYICEK